MKKVAVLHAAIPETAPEDEQDVLVQVQAASRSLTRLGYAPGQVPISLELAAVQHSLASIRPVFVFNLVESLNGQGKLIHLAPALLDSLGIPYTGAATEAVFLTSNKLAAKKILTLSGLDTPPAHTAATLTRGAAVEGRYIIKATWEHASIGIGADSVMCPHNPAELRHALVLASRKIGEDCFCEQYIEGREFNLSLLAGSQGPEVLSPAEIRFDGFPPERLRIVDYRAKWDTASFEYQHTPRS
ncbi:MAG: D-alanine--D-alanine ligase, partial [Desulfobacterales bacterium]|nr:D-alanine--D-alanine ligase [Desulfobacterales bacterium]